MASNEPSTPISRSFNSRWSSAIPMSPIWSSQSRQSTDYQPTALDIARHGQHTVPLLPNQNEGAEDGSPTGGLGHGSDETDRDRESFVLQNLSVAFDEPLAKKGENVHQDRDQSDELVDPFRDPSTEQYARDSKEPSGEFLPSEPAVNSRLPARDGGNLPAKYLTEVSGREQRIRQLWVAAAASIVFAIPLPVFFVIQRTTSDNQQDFNSGIVRRARSYCDVVNSGRPNGFEGLLAVDAAYGNMDFAIAKLIDIIWDICVGRGYQLMFLLVSYRVFTDCLLLMMESATVPYDLYMDLSFDRPSLFTLIPVLRFAYGRSVWRHKCLMTWLVFSILWTALLPSFLSAMTGYGNDKRTPNHEDIGFRTNVDAVPNNKTLAVLSSKETFTDSGYSFNQEYLDETDFFGAQIGYSASVCMRNGTNPYPILMIQNRTAATANYGDPGSGSLSAFRSGSEPVNSTVIEAYDLWKTLNNTLTDAVLNWANISQAISYVSTSSLPSNISTAILNSTCPDAEQPIIHEPGVDNSATSNLDRDFAYFEPLYIIDSVGYPFTWLSYMENVKCYNVNKYQWGFSYYMLLLWVILNSIWTVGTYTLWVSINLSRSSQLSKTSGRLGKYRAALDISEAIREELGPETCAYTNQELDDILKNRPPVRYTVQANNRHKDQNSVLHFGISSSQSREPLDLRTDQIYGRQMEN